MDRRQLLFDMMYFCVIFMLRGPVGCDLRVVRPLDCGAVESGTLESEGMIDL